MNDWSVAMAKTAAEMKSKTTEEITQVVVKEVGMRQSTIKARLKNEPTHTHRKVLITLVAQARHHAIKRANLIRDRRQTR